MQFVDRAIQCLDCKNEFTFTAGEQEFYERKGFRELPKRCKSCREARKSRHAERDESQPSGAVTSDERPRRGPRELYDAVCGSCGAPARVPFRPTNGRPVYCKECYSSRQG